jgi:hypothetical protein
MDVPPPSLSARTLIGAAEHPKLAGLALGGACVVVAALVIARRPRPRPL